MTVKALHHLVCLWMAWWNPIARFFPAAFAGEAIFELTAVIGEQSDDFDWARFCRCGQEINTAAIGLLAIDVHVDSTGGPIDGDKKIAPQLLVWHLRQVLAIFVWKARLIIFKGA